MAKRRMSYPRVKLPAAVIVGRGSVRTVMDDFETERVVFMTSAAPPVVELIGAALGESITNRPWLRKPDGEPGVDAVREAAGRLAAERPTVIIAIGGGAVLDWARLAWATSAGVLDPDAPAANLAPVANAPDFVLVPTTCATGAESATVAVLSRAGEKHPVISDDFLARQVYIDPQFVQALPPQALALYLCDAISHAVESWVSIVPNGMAKEFAVSGLRLIARGFSDPQAPNHQDLLMGAYFSGAAASHCSVGAAHAFAHTAAASGIGHALGNALVLGPVLETLDISGKLDALAVQAGFADPQGLRDWVASVVGMAIVGADTAALGARLVAQDTGAQFRDTMKADVCMRAFPVRLSADELDDLVGRITAAIA